VITLEKIIHHRLPVGFEPVSQAVCKGEIAKVRSIRQDFFPEVSGLLRKRSRIGIEIDEDQVAESLHLDGGQVDLGFAEVLDEFAAPGSA